MACLNHWMNFPFSLAYCKKEHTCSNHGTCGDYGECICDDHYYGPNCNSKCNFKYTVNPDKDKEGDN